MTLQDILAPIEELVVWSFDALLVPLGNMPNTLITLGGFVGVAIWLKMQKDYNRKAEQEGTIK